jgi:hypothetical protein
MRMPGFTATAVFAGPARGGRVVPAIIKGGGNPWADCMADCEDRKCPTQNPPSAKCAADCRKQCGSGIEGGPTGPDTADCNFCKAYQASWIWGCSFYLPEFVCKWTQPDCSAVCD